MSKLTLEHLGALKEAVFPMQFKKNGDGLKKTMLVREVLDFIKSEVSRPDCEIAAEYQNLKKCEPVEEWIAEDGKLFKWTDKGFIPTGGYRFDDDVRPHYCNCAYPERSYNMTTCSKCKKKLL